MFFLFAIATLFPVFYTLYSFRHYFSVKSPRSIIFLTGNPKAGKDTMADMMHREFGYTKLAAADPLREVCLTLVKTLLGVFDPNPDWFSNPEFKDTPFTELCAISGDTPPPYWSTRTPRDIMKCVGTDMIREHDPDFWARLLVSKADSVIEPVIVSDWRFVNEMTTFLRDPAWDVTAWRIVTEDESADTASDHISDNALINLQNHLTTFCNVRTATVKEAQDAMYDWVVSRNDLYKS